MCFNSHLKHLQFQVNQNIDKALLETDFMQGKTNKIKGKYNIFFSSNAELKTVFLWPTVRLNCYYTNSRLQLYFKKKKTAKMRPFRGKKCIYKVGHEKRKKKHS